MSKQVYVTKVLEQLPRLLAQLDRNSYSPTYGCFDWNYWHDKIIDSPSAHSQEHVLVLAYLYRHDFPGNVYYKNSKLREWIIAAMLYWAKVQHRDGSFDEFYFNERQLGATAITLYAVAKSMLLMKGEISADDEKLIIRAANRSALLLAGHDETHLLSNHQSQVIMALLLVQKVTKANFSRQISKKLGRILKGQSEDGWFREYTGADLGYLTTTIAFLSEYFLETKDRSVVEPLKKAVGFVSYFLYPDGTFGGVVGSRNTSHFWPSGFEIMNSCFGKDFPLAGVVVDTALAFLSKGTILSPEKEDRYFGEQLYDFVWAFMNHSERHSGHSTKIPFEASDFRKFFKESKILVVKNSGKYAVVGAGKGGMLKVSDTASGKVLMDNCGLIGRLTSGKVVSTFFNDSAYEVALDGDKLSVSGNFHFVSFSNMSVLKMAVFKAGMLVLGRTMSMSNFIKDVLIKRLITSDKKSNIMFKRVIDLKSFGIIDEISLAGREKFSSLSYCDEYKLIFVAYSKSFSTSELSVLPKAISPDRIRALNTKKHLMLRC